MKKNICISLIVLLIASLLFTGCEEAELTKSGPDLTGTYICSETKAASGTVPAYTHYRYKLEINGNYYKFVEADGTYPAYVVPRMMLVINEKHFNLYTKSAGTTKTAEEIITSIIEEWKQDCLEDNDEKLIYYDWWNDLSTASGTLTQSGSVVELESTHCDTGSWSELSATIQSDGTLKVRVPIEESPYYADRTFKRLELLPDWQQINCY